MILRPYQQKALDEIRGIYAKKSKRVLLHLATGAGKTVIFCQVLKSVFEKGKHAIMVVRGRHLVSQAADRLAREGIAHGVMMPGHWNNNERAPIQVCSIDTLRARKKAPPADIIIIDEAHHAVSDSYRELIAMYPDAFILAVTATPYHDDGLGHIAREVVKPISMKNLIEQKYLVPPIYYAPSTPDMKRAKIVKGDYSASDVEKIMLDSSTYITGDIITHWRKLGENRPTICFAATIKHSEFIAAEFTKNGIACEHIEANTSQHVRDSAIERLVNGELKIITNVGILCTGVDIPQVSCIIMARPTQSYMLYVQQAGRGTRIAEGKKDFIILDHAGNVMRHNFITLEREAVIDPVDRKKKSKKSEVENIRQCKSCFAIYEASNAGCPMCGSTPEKRMLSHRPGELVKLEQPFKIDYDPKYLDTKFANFLAIAKERQYNLWWAYHQMKDEFGPAIADRYKFKIIVNSRPSKASPRNFA